MSRARQHPSAGLGRAERQGPARPTGARAGRPPRESPEPAPPPSFPQPAPRLPPAPPPPPPPAAETLFGTRFELAGRYAALLAGPGVERGLLGPREADRLWDRHLLNCVALAELVSGPARIADVGSGAGLPGVVLAIARPDLEVVLIEPQQRRVSFLAEVVAELGLTNVRICRARAEECHGQLLVPVVTARAVAPLARLARWCLPLLEPGGRLLAVKGAAGRDELARYGASVSAAGGTDSELRRCGVGVLAEPTTVIVVVRAAGPRRPAAKSGGGST